MRCSYIVQPNNKRCRRKAEPGRQWCAFHEEHEAERLANFYAPTSQPFDDSLALAARLEDVDQEIALLRVAIRDSFQAGKIDPARRAIDTLNRLLTAQQRMRKERSQSEFSDELERVLDELDLEDEAMLSSDDLGRVTGPLSDAPGDGRRGG
jgi:hypothetical protein